ncbi:MAG: hypothetical protein PUH24_05095 [Prevotellaceae bacterium]|nr:hypothetical protein [Prevotellaceae bacterium]MDY6131257.1 hypothetical protein [Prevotella sp.]
MMKLKLKYVSPTVEIFRMNGNCLMDSLSMGVSDDPAVGGGDAKGTDLFDEEDMPAEDTWGLQW